MTPRLARVAGLWVPSIPGRAADLKHTEGFARQLKLTVRPVPVRDADDIENAFTSIAKERVGALIVVGGGTFIRERRGLIIALAAKHRLPAMYPDRDYVEAGGLMSYGPQLLEQLRRAATYVDKILKGANPGDLPVEQPTKLELVVNLRTAKALGLSIPQSLALRVDEVIE